MLEPRPNWALFLDIDGTLIDIASRPDAVRTPPGLAQALSRASAWLGGALALASGRTLPEIDQIVAPFRAPCVAQHGAVIRYADGAVSVAGADCIVPQRWRVELRAAAREWPGVLVEEKSHGLAVHYRLAPEWEDEVRRAVEAAVAENPAQFEALPAHMALEIRHRALTKAVAVDRFMARPPFAGRIPVFVGDDVTDEDGFRAAEALGGLGLNVHERFGGEPAQVRRWLETFARRR